MAAALTVLAATVPAAAGAASCPDPGLTQAPGVTALSGLPGSGQPGAGPPGAGMGVEVSRAYATFKPANPLLKGKAVACGSDVRAAFGRSRLRIRAASTATNGGRDSVLYGLMGQQSVIDTMVGSAGGAAFDWSLNGSLVRVEAPQEIADLGFGLVAGGRLFRGRVAARSSFAWVQDGDPGRAAGGLAQRHDVKARLFKLGAARVTALARFERVEPGYRGQAARRKADRQTQQLGTRLAYRRIHLDIIRETSHDNLDGGARQTRRWDTWRLKSTYDLADFGLPGIRIALSGAWGERALDDGTGFAPAADLRALKLRLDLPRGFTTAASHKVVAKFQGDGTRARDSKSTVQFKWTLPDPRAWRTGAALKVSHWQRQSDGQSGLKVSLGFNAASTGADDLRFGLKARAERRSDRADDYGIEARLYFRF